MVRKLIVVDGKGHLIGRMASIVAKQLEYTIIMNKGLLFLESFGIKEILYKNIELILN